MGRYGIPLKCNTNVEISHWEENLYPITSQLFVNSYSLTFSIIFCFSLDIKQLVMKNLSLLLFVALFLVSCQQPSSTWTTIKFIQEKPIMAHLNLGDTANSHGDGMAFEAPIKDTAGNEVGEVLGWLVTVDLMDGDAANPKYLTERIGTMIFNMGEENEIIAQGGTTYRKGEQQMNPGYAQRRAVVGGTGKYKGIEGEVTTTRNDDGTYTHVLNVKIEQ